MAIGEGGEEGGWVEGWGEEGGARERFGEWEVRVCVACVVYIWV